MKLQHAFLVTCLSLPLLAQACASSKRTAQEPRPAPNTPTERRAEINRLFGEITNLRQRAGLPPTSTSPGTDEEIDSEGEPSTMTESVETSPRPSRKSTTCKDICKISTAICDNAEAICQLAADLGDDAWADEKCSSANASCEAATARCSSC